MGRLIPQRESNLKLVKYRHAFRAQPLDYGRRLQQQRDRKSRAAFCREVPGNDIGAPLGNRYSVSAGLAAASREPHLSASPPSSTRVRELPLSSAACVRQTQVLQFAGALRG
jgi:hypothetical protein